MHVGVERNQLARFFARSPDKAAFITWLVLSFAPFFVYGKDWGMVWTLYSLPAAMCLKWITPIGGTSAFVILATIVNGLALAALVAMVARIHRVVCDARL